VAGFRNKKILGSYPVFTVMMSFTLAMFAMGLFALLMWHAQLLTQNVRETIEMEVFLKKETTDSIQDGILDIITARNFVLKKNGDAQIRYISREEAKQNFIKTYGEDFTTVLEENPLYASFKVKIKPEFSDSISLRSISQQLSRIEGVKEVYYQEALINKVNRNIKKISVIIAVGAIILLFASMLLINNTIRLAIYSQRFLVRSMQLVGATSWFIQKPFLIRALLQGFMSGVIAVLLLAAILKVAYTELPQLAQLANHKVNILIFVSLLLVGSILGFLSSYRAIRKYLNMSLDELY
jgi:cell division transport system permease protein